MKKLLVLFILFVMLAVVTPVFAGDVDGLWSSIGPDQSLSFAMVRETAGILLVTILDPSMNDWSAIYGPFDGTTAHLTTLVSRWEQLGMTLTLLSPNSASVTITSCTSTASAQCENGIIGMTFTFQKLF